MSNFPFVILDLWSPCVFLELGGLISYTCCIFFDGGIYDGIHHRFNGGIWIRFFLESQLW